MEVYGDEMLDGLACPPLEDFAFNFVSDDAAMNLDADIFFNDQVIEDVSDRVPIRLKRQQPPRKGKELKKVIQVLKPTQDQLKWIAECLKQDQEQEAEADPVVNKKINNQPNKIAEPKREYCDKKKVLGESSIELKFESAKRKLHDSYQRIEDAKRKKKIQLIEFQNPLPKPKPKPKAMMGSMKKNCLGGQKCYKFHHSIAIPQY